METADFWPRPGKKGTRVFWSIRFCVGFVSAMVNWTCGMMAIPGSTWTFCCRASVRPSMISNRAWPGNGNLAGVPLLNETAAVNVAKDKYLTLQSLAHAGVAVPDTLLVTRDSDVSRAVRDLGGFPLVVKRRRGRKGRGVALVNDHGQLSEFMDSLETPEEAALLQEFMQTPGLRDLRVLVIHGQAVAGMGRKPAEGDFRSNIGQAGQGYRVTLTEAEKRLAERATAAVGLDVSGVDLLSAGERMFILEVNYTPGIGGIEKVTGMDVARLIVRAAAAKAEGGAV